MTRGPGLPELEGYPFPGETGPDYGHGYLRVPLRFWEGVFCRAPITRRQLQLRAVILRESWGWGKKGGEVRLWTRPLAVRDFAAATGLSTDHLARDLRALVRGGVVRERDGRYHLVADPRLGKSLGIKVGKALGKSLGTALEVADPPLKRRSRAQKPPPLAAESALLAPVLKKEDRKHTNGLPASPDVGAAAGDNFSHPAPSPAERLLAILDFLAGPFSPERRAALAGWIQEDGVAAVWQALEASLRAGRETAQSRLAALLRGRSDKEASVPGAAGREGHG